MKPGDISGWVRGPLLPDWTPAHRRQSCTVRRWRNEIAQSRRNCASVHPGRAMSSATAELRSNASAVIKVRRLTRSQAHCRRGLRRHGNGSPLIASAPASRNSVADNRRVRRRRPCSDGNGQNSMHLPAEPWPSQTAALLAWVRNYAPIFMRAGTAFMCKDFITYRLTGARGGYF
jgi:hypothetical protein